jgi:hypothetical protein
MTAENTALCFPCSHPARYDAASMRWFKTERKLCVDHEKKTDELLAQLPAADAPKKLITRPVKKNWQDREPGEDG